MADATEVTAASRSYEVENEVFSMVFDFDADEFYGDNKNRINSAWRRFYGKVTDIVGVAGVSADIKLVTKNRRSLKKTGTVYAKHSKVLGNGLCPASFNFSLQKPIDKTAAKFTFKLSILNGDNCNCGESLPFGLLIGSSNF